MSAQRIALGDLRRKRRLTLRDLATRTGIEYMELFKAEHGESMPPPQDRARIAEALDCTPDEIWIVASDGYDRSREMLRGKLLEAIEDMPHRQLEMLLLLANEFRRSR